MNLPVIFSKFLKAAKGFGSKALVVGKKHAPEICFGIGVAGFVGTVAGTVHATNQTRDILDEKEAFEEMCDKCLSRENESYTRKNYEEDMKHIKKKTRRKLFRAWWPVGTMGAGSVISFFSGFRILNGRYLATAAAYKTLEAGYERYRENVVARFGKDVDRELMDIKAEEVEKKLKAEAEAQKAEDEKGGKKKKRKALPQGSEIQIFDERSGHWRKYWTADMVLDYLSVKENECNDKREMNGHIFVNEILDILGLPRTCEGQVLGYIDKPVNFGLFDGSEVAVRRARNILSINRNCDIHVPIHLEPEGIIFDRIGKKH